MAFPRDAKYWRTNSIWAVTELLLVPPGALFLSTLREHATRQDPNEASQDNGVKSLEQRKPARLPWLAGINCTESGNNHNRNR